MTALLALTTLGFVAALAIGGSIDGWRQVRIRWWLPALGALAIQLVVYNPPIDRQPWALTVGPWLFVAAKSLLVAALAYNAFKNTQRVAWSIALLGATLNVIVIAANGGYMPQSTEGRLVAYGTTLAESETTPRLINVKPIDDSARLAFLSDVVAQPRWVPRANVVSVGDLLLAAGLGVWAFQVTASGRRSLVQRRATADT
jgi:Family of unknown function (DUF5317)